MNAKHCERMRCVVGPAFCKVCKADCDNPVLAVKETQNPKPAKAGLHRLAVLTIERQLRKAWLLSPLQEDSNARNHRTQDARLLQRADLDGAVKFNEASALPLANAEKPALYSGGEKQEVLLFTTRSPMAA